jgi:hypothetical protein
MLATGGGGEGRKNFPVVAYRNCTFFTNFFSSGMASRSGRESHMDVPSYSSFSYCSRIWLWQAYGIVEQSTVIQYFLFEGK